TLVYGCLCTDMIVLWYMCRLSNYAYPTRRSSDLAACRNACIKRASPGQHGGRAGRVTLPVTNAPGRAGSDPGRPHSPRLNPFREDRKSTRLNSSHVKSSYDVFFLKKKKQFRV